MRPAIVAIVAFVVVIVSAVGLGGCGDNLHGTTGTGTCRAPRRLHGRMRERAVR
jgi:hypothetical protein